VEDAEKALFAATQSVSDQLSNSKDYAASMNELISLKASIDNFFDQVMVNSDVAELKQARLNLINWVRSLFLSVADVSHLSA
ncbi:DALR anticodon-binding domain-containing protein, partial [Candidatus Thioglobus sp.]|nr:DALR anticodon-binding domain-containing protein [Candidatus Thioglobus sp.]